MLLKESTVHAPDAKRAFARCPNDLVVGLLDVLHLSLSSARVDGPQSETLQPRTISLPPPHTSRRVSQWRSFLRHDTDMVEQV